MNRNKLKSYAPQARRDFIEAVTSRAAQYGLTAKKIEPMTVEGDVAIIAGKPHTKAVGEKRKKLEARIKRDGFGQTMEAVAYTWFNRLVAIRFLELHGYLEHGYRVLSHSEGHYLPEIVGHAEHVDLPDLDKKKVVELKLDGTKEEELYRMLLLAQCNALQKAMPFLFESIDDETELLLPDHLLHSDSLIRNLINEIPEEGWQDVEIIGWLYQFYISEKKDQVIGKVVKSEDIPAATQLFTPNWIVKYLVQNSLGRQWVATYPDSPLSTKPENEGDQRYWMEYYIEPAEQTPEVQAKLAEITPDGLNPEELTLLDPACGSGHILVEAYDLLKAIYQERGYRAKDIPRLILEKNLYGLEIDDRAAQLAAFALMMKARADDRSIFERGVQPHVLSIQESKGLDAKEITEAINAPLPDGSTGDISQADVSQLIELFAHGKTFGSLIRVPKLLSDHLATTLVRVRSVTMEGGMFESATALSFWPMLKQTVLLARQYKAVVSNPPYMGGKYYSKQLKQFVTAVYTSAKADLYGCFISRNTSFAAANGIVGMITIPNWMFLSSFQDMRQSLVNHQSFETFVHNGRGVFGSDFGTCAFTFRNMVMPELRGSYLKLFEKQGSVASNDELQRRFQAANPYQTSGHEFRKIPGSPLAYWISDRTRNCFAEMPSLGESATLRQGLATGDNDRFIRYWFEVACSKLGFGHHSRTSAWQSDAKWFPYNKGGAFRRWYGNNEFVLSFDAASYEVLKTVGNQCPSESYYFKPGITWSLISIAAPSFRAFGEGFVIGHKGCGIYCSNANDMLGLIGILNSTVTTSLLQIVSPTVGFEVGQIRTLPVPPLSSVDSDLVEKIVRQHKNDWNYSEYSWDFSTLDLLPSSGSDEPLVRLSHQRWVTRCHDILRNMKAAEIKNNEAVIRAYGLQDELSPEVSDDHITLYRPNCEEDIKRLISYSTGCMMGRYSLDEPGLIYAHSGNVGFDPSKYHNFPADEDGIIPLTEFHWFPDDAASRFEKFVATAWPKEHLEENLKFVAESLGDKKGESPRDTIRRYLAADFYKHHLSLYKRRPIYWLFSSGKQRGFQALVYLHRYNESTLARMRTEYVIPLLGKMTARIDHLTDEIAAATSSQHKKRLETEKATVVKQLAEVQSFDEKLRHYADHRIKLDLDDGVKANYGKFGDLLAEVKAVSGTKDKE